MLFSQLNILFGTLNNKKKSNNSFLETQEKNIIYYLLLFPNFTVAMSLFFSTILFLFIYLFIYFICSEFCHTLK